MSSRQPQTRVRLLAWLFAAALILQASALRAAPINYGNFGPDFPPGVLMYLGVTESSGTDPLPPGKFGPPQLTGDVLDFDPTEFVAFASGGSADITDVQLNFTLMSLPLTGITSLLFTEGGDFTLMGAGTALTQVVAGLSISIDILEVDGVPLGTPLQWNASNAFMANLVADGPAVLAFWDNGLLVDFGAILDDEEIEYELGVSKAKVAIDDQLLAFSESNSIAFIAKKDFTIWPNVAIDPSFMIPEPTSLAMMVIAIVGFGIAFRRRIFSPRA